VEIIIHRVNRIKELKNIEPTFGTEIDIRAQGGEIILSHDPFVKGDKLGDYLDEYNHGILVLNIKEDGIEDDVLGMVRERKRIKDYFLLDVEFPYLFKKAKAGEMDMAIRFSEDECIQTVQKYINKVNWVWIDCNTTLPLNKKNIKILNNFKKCLVCPERWGRPNDLIVYKKIMKSLPFNIDAVMTSNDYAYEWLK
tara:strand:- start:231 stop:818 length:588 start_codon:yes stop_codon:yes gene_type:complete